MALMLKNWENISFIFMECSFCVCVCVCMDCVVFLCRWMLFATSVPFLFILVCFFLSTNCSLYRGSDVWEVFVNCCCCNRDRMWDIFQGHSWQFCGKIIINHIHFPSVCFMVCLIIRKKCILQQNRKHKQKT